MADDRTIAPGPARWRRAWAAGLRPRARWLWPAAVFLLLAAAIDGVRGSSPLALGLDLRPGAVEPRAWLGIAVGWLAAILGAAGLVGLVSAVVTRQLGPVSSVARRRLRAAPERPAELVRLLLAAAVGMGLLLALVGVVAGAARSVDASEAGLTTLWLGWAQRGSTGLAIALMAGAAVELWLDWRERGARLGQSSQQLRDEAHAAGSSSR